MSLTTLPPELLLQIGTTMYSEPSQPRALNALARTSAHIYNILNPLLYTLNAKTDHSTALLWAASHGHVSTARLSIAAGADVNVFAELESSPLHWASENGHEGVVQVLLAAPGIWVDGERTRTRTRTSCTGGGGGGYAHRGGPRGAGDTMTPMMLAARNGHVAIIRMLIGAGADAERRDMFGRTALRWAMGCLQGPAMMAILGATRERREAAAAAGAEGKEKEDGEEGCLVRA
ncbi:ankyrin repeat-containing domain protein [Aspergillus carlsbadensis]|nr:ankyrin repeat-containing domain protein [Aspergillus carlsbadensis]